MRRLIFLAAGVCLAGCLSSPGSGGGGSTGATSAHQICAPGASVACVGVGGCQGGQTCNSEGSGYGACNCGMAASTSGSVGGSSSGGSSCAGDLDSCATEPCCPELTCLDGEAEGMIAICASSNCDGEGGQCCWNGSSGFCNAGLTCVAGMCEKPSGGSSTSSSSSSSSTSSGGSGSCDVIGASCCVSANGSFVCNGGLTCTGPSGVCVGSASSGGTSTSCGGSNQACCSGSSCAPGLNCIYFESAGTGPLCVAELCGSLNEQCCWNGSGGSCENGSSCINTSSEYFCWSSTTCGNLGQDCCAGGLCAANMACWVSFGASACVSASCGAEGHACCWNGFQAVCASGLYCNGSACETPPGLGNAGEPCLDGGACGTGSVCFDDGGCFVPTCVTMYLGDGNCDDSTTLCEAACGSSGQSCCGGASAGACGVGAYGCNAGLSCQDGTCG